MPTEGVIRLIPGTDIRVHPLALDGSIFGWVSGVPETARTLDRFAAAGGNLVSTADHYAGGRSEVMIGSWLRTLPDRGRAIIATKIGKHPDAPGLSTRMVVRAMEASLRRLNTEYVDLVSLDGEDPRTPIDDTLEAIDMLRRAGKVRYLSASGFPPNRIREINEFAQAAAYPTFRQVSVVYNLMQRSAYETGLAATVNELHIGVCVRRPLASGYLTGLFRTRDDELLSPVFADAFSHVGRRGNRVLHTLASVAVEHHASLGRVALAWVLTKPGVTAAAVRVSGAEQLAELMGDGVLHLTRHQVSELDRASQPELPRRLVGAREL